MNERLVMKCAYHACRSQRNSIVEVDVRRLRSFYVDCDKGLPKMSPYVDSYNTAAKNVSLRRLLQYGGQKCLLTSTATMSQFDFLFPMRSSRRSALRMTATW